MQEDANYTGRMTTEQQAMIIESFRSNTYVRDRMDVQNTPIYDTITYNAAASISETNSAFFTDVGSSSGKTLAETNMTQPNRLVAPEAFAIFGIRFLVRPDILLADYNSIFYGGFALDLVLGTKSYNRAPLWYYAAGAGTAGWDMGTAASNYANGQPSRESMHKLAIGLVIENQMVFSANFRGDTFTLESSGDGGTGARFQLLLDGLYARGVQ